jgi:hypothetical protein
VRIIRGILLRGASLADVHARGLAAARVPGRRDDGVSILRFRKRLD